MRTLLDFVEVPILIADVAPDTVTLSIKGKDIVMQEGDIALLLRGTTTKLLVQSFWKTLTGVQVVDLKIFNDSGENSESGLIKGNTLQLNIHLDPPK